MTAPRITARHGDPARTEARLERDELTPFIVHSVREHWRAVLCVAIVALTLVLL